MLSPTLIASLLAGYFIILIVIAWYTSRQADTTTFFTGNRQSSWYLVAFGMIGTSLSGVTFISVPGKVGIEGMAYFQVVMGYILGYVVIAQVLMPLYYRMNLVSIYEYLSERFGWFSYKTGAAFFILSRTLGSAMRLYLATVVLQLFLFDAWGVDYWITATTTIALIWVYTFKGGIKTIVITDAFQTLFLVGSVVICTYVVAGFLHVDLTGLFHKISKMTAVNGQSMTNIICLDDYKSALFFPKQFFGGAALAVAMTGLDQDLMQKNLTCKSIGDAQKNMYSFTVILIIVNFFFLLLGGALYVYAQEKGVALPMDNGVLVSDRVFPTFALNEFGVFAGILFILGITASSYASADSALTALTTGFCIDFLNFQKREEKEKKKLKLITHIGFSVLFLLISLLMKEWANKDLIGLVLTVASFTYGPLMGLFFFGILTKRSLKDQLVPIVCIVSPIICYVLNLNAVEWLNGYQFGFELLILNGLLTFAGLWMISSENKKSIVVEG